MKESWHLDKKVPISLLGGLAIQTLVFVWWAASYTAANDARNVAQDEAIKELKQNTSVLSNMQADLAVVKSTLTDIKFVLNKR